jgi:hypothetical protein
VTQLIKVKTGYNATYGSRLIKQTLLFNARISFYIKGRYSLIFFSWTGYVHTTCGHASFISRRHFLEGCLRFVSSISVFYVVTTPDLRHKSRAPSPWTQDFGSRSNNESPSQTARKNW